jgi:hypothetical protein
VNRRRSLRRFFAGLMQVRRYALHDAFSIAGLVLPVDGRGRYQGLSVHSSIQRQQGKT